MYSSEVGSQGVSNVFKVEISISFIDKIKMVISQNRGLNNLKTTRQVILMLPRSVAKLMLVVLLFSVCLFREEAV